MWGAYVERTRDFGAVYLGLILWRALKLDKLLGADAFQGIAKASLGRLWRRF